MKNNHFKYELIILALFISQFSFAAGTDDFVMQIKTNHPGTSADTEFTIQTTGTGYNYNVDCNLDGTFEATGQTGNYVCVYGSPGNKFISIEDNVGDGTGFPRIYYNNTGDHRKVLDVAQWGTGKWTSMAAAFRGAQNMQLSAGDVPDLSLVTDLSSMFRFATLVNPDTSLWDVSGVTTFHSMFRSASAANPDTSNWNTSSAQLMTRMFWNATSVNPDVSSWDVSGVTDMTLMFGNVTLPTVAYDSLLITFESQLVQNNVTLDGGNSKFCSLPAQIAHANLMADHIWTVNDGGICAPSDPVNDFVFTIVTNNSGFPSDDTFTIPTTGTGYKYNVDCNDDGSFEATGLTGSYICDYSSLGGPGTYTIRIVDDIGDGTGFPRVRFGHGGPEASEIIELNNWGTGLWDSMESAFANTVLMQILANDAPDLSNVTDASKMFSNANSANPDTSVWDTSNIENMSEMFFGAWDANPDTSNWITSNVSDMSFMFMQASIAQPDTSNWDTSQVKFMEGMFLGTSLANPVMSSWVIGNVTDMTNMFLGITLSTSNYDAALINFASQAVKQGVNFNAGNSKYCAIAAHDALEQSESWVITDAGINGFCPSAMGDFVIQVDTTITGSTSNTQFEINTTGVVGYNYNIDCDSANTGSNAALAQTGNYICNYAVPGVYTIRIQDNVGDKTGFPRIYSLFHGDAKKITQLKQWGTGLWASMKSAFNGASNMVVSATDNPDLSNLTSLNSMFGSASLVNPNTSNWDTTNVTNMSGMFNNASAANPDTSSWITTNVTDMSSMFNSATSADPDVSQWNVANVEDMGDMFSGATLANPVTSNWITTGAIDMSYMFEGATLANPDVSGWDVSNVEDMESMFAGATSATPVTSSWITTSVTDMSSMFEGATAADPDTSGWNTANVTRMHSMFSGATSADPIASNWDIENVTSMTNMFVDVTLTTNNYDAMLVNFASQNVTQGLNFHAGNSQYCAIAAHAILENTNGWAITDTGIAPICAYGADGFIITVNTANTQVGSSTTTQFTIPLSTTPSVLANYDYNVDCDLANIGTNIASGVTADYTCNYTNPGIYTLLISDNTGLKTGFPAFQAHSNDDNLKIIELNQWGTGIWSTMSFAFQFAENMTVNAIDTPDLSVVTNIGNMFTQATLANPDVSNWDTSNITFMQSVFFNATSANPDVSTWDTTQVTNMGLMFSGATAANPDVSDWITSNVVNMYRMFAGASVANPDVSTWNTSSVTDMNSMFDGATLANPDVSSWITTNVTDMQEMFSSASNANPDVSSWDTANVILMNAMFRFATSADPDLSSWDVENVTNFNVMFLGVTLSQQNYDALLANFSSQNLHSGRTFHGGNSTYCDVAAHDILENTFSWAISDGGLDAGCPSDVIFSNGFEDVVIFKSTASQFEYDFAKTAMLDLDEQPRLIAQGMNAIQLTVIEVYLRNDLGQLQIRKDYFDALDKVWVIGQWQSIENNKLTTISWYK